MMHRKNNFWFSGLMLTIVLISVLFWPFMSSPAMARSYYPALDPPKIDKTPAVKIPQSSLGSFSAQPPTEWTWHKTLDNAHPDGQEQQMLWLINRARSNPNEEGIWLATSSDPDITDGRVFFNVDTDVLKQEFSAISSHPPAAFDRRLYSAAYEHSLDLISRDAQDHNNQFDRIQQNNFIYSQARGNVFSYAKNALNAHAALNIDWGPGDNTGM